MAEARARRNCHFTSNIFKNESSEVPRRVKSVNNKNYESHIFIPAEAKPMRTSYSREKYFETNEIFSKESFINPEPVTSNNNHALNPAGFKERYVAPDHILGNDKTHYYKKNQKKNAEVPTFQPKYDEKTIQERIEKELYGGFHIYRSSQTKKLQKFEESAKHRKRNNLTSTFDSYKNDENVPPEPIKEKTEYSASKRKFEILASGVFNEKPSQDFPRVSRREDFDDKRRKNHLFSDLAGRDDYVQSKKELLVSASQNWLYQSTKPNNLTYDPNSHAFDYFRSSLTPQPSGNLRTRSSEAASGPCSPVPAAACPSFTSMKPGKVKIEEARSELQPLQEFSDKTPEVYEILLTKVPRTLDKVDLRKICEGMHVISTELDTDNLTGASKGTGSIKLRCGNEKKLKNFECKLLKEGIETKPRAKSNLVKHTWFYSDDKMKKESEPKFIKVRELESNVFGKPRKFTPVRQQRDTAFQSLMQWKKTQNAKREFC